MTIIKLGDLVEVLETNNSLIRGKTMVLDKIDVDSASTANGAFFVDQDPDREDGDVGGQETTFTTYGWAVRIRLVSEDHMDRIRYTSPSYAYPNRVEVDGDGKFVRAWRSINEAAAQDAVAVDEDEEHDDENTTCTCGHPSSHETPVPALLPVGSHVVIKRATWAEESEGNTGVIERNDAPAEFTDVDDVTRSHPYRIKEDNTGRTIYAAEVKLVDSTPESNDPAEAPKPVLSDPATGKPVETLGDFLRAILGGGVDVEPPQIVSMGIITPDGKMQEMTPEELAARGVFVHGPDCGCEDPGALPEGEPDLYQKLAELAEEAEASRHDPVNHPSHYTSMPTGVECIDVIEWMNLCRGNAIKYIWRAGQKDPSKEIEDLEKAVWYLNREIDRLRRVQR